MHSAPYYPGKSSTTGSLLWLSPTMMSDGHGPPSRGSTRNGGERDIIHSGYSPARKLSASLILLTPSTMQPSSPALLPFAVLPSMQRHGRPPGIQRCRPLPSQDVVGRPVVMHPKLMRKSDSTPPPSRFDLSSPFDDLQHIMEGEQYPPSNMVFLLDEVTDPPLPSITLIHPLLPWCITAHASGINSRGVAVVDILCAIYEAVQKELYLEGEVYRRLVFLKGRRTLVGLIKSDIGGDIWEMIVE